MELWLEKLKQLTLLYAEDEEGIRKPMTNSLSYYFKEVYEAQNGAEGLDIYDHKRPTSSWPICECLLKMGFIWSKKSEKMIRKPLF